MKIVRLNKISITGFLCALLLTGFTGKEKYVSLESLLNGRSSGTFGSNDRNILDTLPKGTRGKILAHQYFQASGNYGLKIEVLNGPNTGKTYWVYHRTKNSSLALYEDIPQDWKNDQGRATSAIEKARSAEALRDVTAKPVKIKPTNPTDTTDVREALKLINQSNKTVRLADKTASCSNCELSAEAGKVPLLRKSGPPMHEGCSDLMNSDGQLGRDGQTIYAIMSEPTYESLYTGKNALGRFCPKFNQLTKDQKLIAWTWMWTALSSVETTTCDHTTVHGTTYIDKSGKRQILNPREGYGLWALERDRLVRAWRKEPCENISSVEGQARCAIDTMRRTLASGKSGGPNPDSYWGPIRRGDEKIMPHMRRLTLCF